MIRLLCICLIFGLGLSACKKEKVNDADFHENHLKIHGEWYSLDYLKSEMAREIKITQDSLVYNKEDSTFSLLNYSGIRFSVLKLFPVK